MKIFQIITVSEYGGAQSVVASLLEEMNKDTNNTLYVLSGGDGESWKYLDSRIIRIKIDKHRKQISIQDLFLLFKLFYYRFKYNPDIVHLHSSKMGALGRIAFSRRKTVYTVHGFDSVRKAFKKYLFLEKLLKNRTACIVGVSKYDVECLKEEGIEGNVAMVYNGIHDYPSESATDTFFPKQISELEEIRKDYLKVIMCISRISKQKKFELFLDVAEQLPEYAFVWIGNKEEVTGSPANVFCLGECHSAHRCLEYTDIFILPSNYEGTPVSVIEALSYGKPVVASSVGGLPEMLNGKNGFAVENDINSFTEKIKYILSTEETYQSMSFEARKTYEDHFTIDKMIEGYEEIYKTIMSKNKRR